MSNQTTRRGMLGAMAVAPLAIVSTSVLAQSNPTQWSAHVREWREHNASYEAYCHAEPDSTKSPEYDAWFEKSGNLCVRDWEMLDVLMREPTPDAAAFREKAEIYLKLYEVDEADPLGAIFKDALRHIESEARHG